MKFDLSKFKNVKDTEERLEDKANNTRSVCLSDLDIKYIKKKGINLSKLAREIIRELRLKDDVSHAKEDEQ